MSKLFVEKSEEVTTNRKAGNKLMETVKLEEVVMPIASEVIAAVTDEEFLKDEANEKLVADSQSAQVAMEELLSIVGAQQKVAEQTAWLKDSSEEALTKVLKSQQSKRSRSRKAEMTLENYRKLVEASLCEGAARLALGKERKTSAMADYTQLKLDDETATKFKEDQDALRKEIRNTQSKKSIMKHRDDFSEEDENWLALVAYENSLKELRVSAPRVSDTINKKLEAANEAKDVLSGVEDIDTLKAKDAKELLKKVSEALATEF